MKKTNYIFKSAIVACIFAVFQGFAQNNNLQDGQARIVLAAYVPEQIDNMPGDIRAVLSNKLNQVISNNGLAGSAYQERFIITANVVTLNKDITSTAPPMTALSLEVNFYIGDGYEGTKFATRALTVKGVGINETKAYIEAIKSINASDKAFASFIEEGKSKIIRYYESNCDFIIKEANQLASLNKHGEAIYKLMGVPNAATQCFDKAVAATGPIFRQKIDRDCRLKLSEANNIWNASQDLSAAYAAGEILSTVEPSSACFRDVQALHAKIEKRVLEVDKREWNFVLKTQEQEGDMIRAYRDVGVAYGSGQPETITYNLRGWW